MIGVRTLARSLLASMFIVGGIDALRRAPALAPVAENVTEPVSEQVGIDASTETLVKVNGGVQLAGGVMLATCFLPRWGALALAGTLVPTTLAAHRFWEEEGEAKTQQMIHFCKNAGLLGGLLFAALDHGGRPSVFWTTKRAVGGAAAAVGAGAGAALDAVTPS
jgi:putative oxidoreductase